MTRLAMVLLGCLSSSCVVPGSGRPETRTLALAGFDTIEAGDGFELLVTRSDGFAVSVSADDNLWGFVEATRDGRAVRLGIESPVLHPNATLRAHVSMPALAGVSLSGGALAELYGFDVAAPRLDVSASGGSRASGLIRAEALSLALSGGSLVELSGGDASLVGSGRVVAEGGSFVRLTALPLARADVRLSGASEAVIAVETHLDYDLSGGSRLTYEGQPQLGRTSVSGGSEVIRR